MLVPRHHGVIVFGGSPHDLGKTLKSLDFDGYNFLAWTNMRTKEYTMQSFYMRHSALLITIISGLVQALPQRITHSSIIELSEDVVHFGLGSPFIAGETFGSAGPEKLVIMSNTGNALIIKKGSTWDLSSFSGKNKIIEFAGNARLVCEPGAQLHGTGGVLRFVDDARLIVGKE